MPTQQSVKITVAWPPQVVGGHPNSGVPGRPVHHWACFTHAPLPTLTVMLEKILFS